MSLLLLFSGGGVAPPIPIYNLATTGGKPSLATTGGTPSLSTQGPK